MVDVSSDFPTLSAGADASGDQGALALLRARASALEDELAVSEAKRELRECGDSAFWRCKLRMLGVPVPQCFDSVCERRETACQYRLAALKEGAASEDIPADRLIPDVDPVAPLVSD